MMDKILKMSLDEIKKGYYVSADIRVYTCHVCGRQFEAGEVFSIDDKFYEASKAIQHHVAKEHGDMLNILSSYDKKHTTLTENQRELLQLIGSGLSDNEIARSTGVAPSTVRHQRFVFREKAKQAKLYLAIFEIAEEAALRKERNTNDSLIEVHDGAKMVDDRYFITESEEGRIISAAFESLQPLKLKLFSPKEKKKIVILRKISSQFTKGVKYSENEVNSILKPIYEDYATIRRYLIEYGFMERTKNCREYWLK